MSADDLRYQQETYALRGAYFEVYKEKDCGFLESVYQECLAIEFELQGIVFVPQPRQQLEYKGRALRSEFIPDFICHGKIVLELKAASKRPHLPWPTSIVRKFTTSSRPRDIVSLCW